MQQWTVTEPWLDAQCALAEGPFYEKASDSLRFVDIKKKQICWVRQVSAGDRRTRIPKDAIERIQLDVSAGVTADIEDMNPAEEILVGLKHGLAILDCKTHEYELLAPFNDEYGPSTDRLRANDGAADPAGNFWLGTMTDFGLGPFKPEGSLYRFSGDGTKTTVLPDVTIPNGIGWSPDQRIMYFTHSPTREVFAFDYDAASGNISNKRLFYQHSGTAEPDGMRVDVQGHIWQAFYGEGMVLRINPEGQVVGKISLPTKNITCVQFVGDDLVITSAADDGEADSNWPESARLGGALFRVDVGVKGLDLFPFKLRL